LIGSAVVILVLYETTVLMKLWFATATMKMSVLQETKLLRLEVARLATAVGVEEPSEPPVKYEPMRGTSRTERGFWLTACMAVAVATSTWTSHAWHLGGGGDSSAEIVVNLAADGTAEKQTKTVKPYSSYYRPSGFSLYAPKECDVRLLDSMGQQLPVDVVAMDTQNRHDVTFTDGVFVDGQMRYTQIVKTPNAAILKDGVWTYQDGLQHVGSKKEFSMTIVPPRGAKLLAAEPTPATKVDEDGRTHLRFEGTAGDNKKFTFKIRYELPSTSEQGE
ncbi:MAG TPA: hypothetical protein VE890_03585, partial [Thermoguttaceae bacterium]|nr:hypothetical protein [Thermoguttaceae bacterium]